MSKPKIKIEENLLRSAVNSAFEANGNMTATGLVALPNGFMETTHLAGVVQPEEDEPQIEVHLTRAEFPSGLASYIAIRGVGGAGYTFYELPSNAPSTLEPDRLLLLQECVDCTAWDPDLTQQAASVASLDIISDQ